MREEKKKRGRPKARRKRRKKEKKEKLAWKLENLGDFEFSST